MNTDEMVQKRRKNIAMYLKDNGVNNWVFQECHQIREISQSIKGRLNLTDFERLQVAVKVRYNTFFQISENLEPSIQGNEEHEKVEKKVIKITEENCKILVGMVEALKEKSDLTDFEAVMLACDIQYNNYVQFSLGLINQSSFYRGEKELNLFSRFLQKLGF